MLTRAPVVEFEFTWSSRDMQPLSRGVVYVLRSWSVYVDGWVDEGHMVVDQRRQVVRVSPHDVDEVRRWGVEVRP